MIDAVLDGELPSGSGTEFPQNLELSDTIQCANTVNSVGGSQ
ncbi:MAG TPA: hypothetical protein VGL35_02525 [Rhizomicrobium sp.]